MSLAERLSRRGFPAEHTSRLGFNAASDLDIARHAVSVGAVVVTKDADYVTLARRMTGLRVVHMQVGNLSSRDLLAFCDQAWPRAVAALEAADPAVRLTLDLGGVR